MITEYVNQFDRRPLRPLRPVRWADGGAVLMDQRRLPHEEVYLHFSTSEEVAQGIRDMVVRGAPAIGLAAAYGAVLAAAEADAIVADRSPQRWLEQFRQALRPLAEARPTAVNLGWALAQMDQAAQRLLMAADQAPVAELKQLADELVTEDLAEGEQMAEFGAGLIEPGSVVLTHCNAGALATGGVGTAVGVINAAWRQGRIDRVYASETRPWLQGSRLTAWELQQQGIDPCVLVEGAVGALLRDRGVSWLIVGADRIAVNGDVANKIGTYGAALLARQHGVKVMVVAPTSTIDPALASGDEIEIEQRGSDEITEIGGVRVAADGVEVWNPVFDVTPAQLVDFIVTEKGVVKTPSTVAIQSLLA